MLELQNEIVEVICQHSSPAALLNLRAVHKRFTAITKREILLSCHIWPCGRSIVVMAEVAGKGRLNIDKGAASVVKKCWIPQIREIIVYSEELHISLQAISRIQQMRNLQPGVHLKFEGQILASEFGRLVKRVEELPPPYFKVHMNLLDDEARTMICVSDEWFATMTVICSIENKEMPYVFPAGSGCKFDLILQGLTIDEDFFVDLQSGVSF